MALNQSYDLYDLLCDKFGNKKDYYKMSRIEKDYLKKLSIKRDDKSLRRIADIKSRIINDLNKNNFNKKYQIQSFSEYNMIKEFCKSLDLKGYELLWHHDEHNVKRKQLYKIIEGGDKPMTFISRQVLVKYCHFYKN